MVVRIGIESEGIHLFGYQVSHEAEMLYGDTGLNSVAEALVAAIEGLPPEVVGVEVACSGIVSGTYPLEVVAMNLAQVAAHAVNTTAALHEALANKN